MFGQVFGHFALAATITWVLLVIANALGATRAWFLALLAGFASSCLAALIATTFTVGATSRNPFSGALFVFVVSSLVSLNLIFIIAVILAEVFVAPRVMRGILGHTPSGRRAYRAGADSRVESRRGRADAPRAPTHRQELADEQWDNYCAALAAEGWETVEIDAAPELADSVFVEDTVVMFGDLAVITNPGAESAPRWRSRPSSVTDARDRTGSPSRASRPPARSRAATC